MIKRTLLFLLFFAYASPSEARLTPLSLSPQMPDKSFSEREGIPGYLGTPKGAIKKYTPGSGDIKLLNPGGTKKDRIDNDGIVGRK